MDCIYSDGRNKVYHISNLVDKRRNLLLSSVLKRYWQIFNQVDWWKRDEIYHISNMVDKQRNFLLSSILKRQCQIFHQMDYSDGRNKIYYYIIFQI